MRVNQHSGRYTRNAVHCPFSVTESLGKENTPKTGQVAFVALGHPLEFGTRIAQALGCVIVNASSDGQVNRHACRRAVPDPWTPA